MIWTEAVEQIALNQKLSTTLLWQHRVFLDREESYQSIYWLSLKGKIANDLMVSGGIMYITYHRLSSERFLTVPEWRPFQSIVYSKNIGNVKVNLRVMLEERYERNVWQGDLQSGYAFRLRERNRLQVYIPIAEWMHLEISDEILIREIDHLKAIFDQNRARLRLHFGIRNTNLQVNLGYLHWLVNTPSAVQHRHAGMIGVRHHLKIKG